MGPRKRAKGKMGATSGSSASSTASPAMPSPSTGASHASETSAPNPVPASESGTPMASQPVSPFSSHRDNPTDIASPSRKPSQQTISDPTTLQHQEASQSQTRKTKSWYGSWPRVPKLSASTQVAGETIQGRTLRPRKTADFSKYETRKASDSASIYTTTPSTTTLPSIGENGDSPSGDGGENNREANIQSGQTDGQADTPKPAGGSQVVKQDDSKDQAMAGESVTASSTDTPALVEEAPSVSGAPVAEASQQPATASGWLGPLGWWSRPGAETKADTAATQPGSEESAGLPKEMDVDPTVETSTEPPAPTEPTAPTIQDAQEPEQAQQAAAPRSSWFGIWSNTTATPSQPPEASTEQAAESDKSMETAKEPEDVVMEDAPPVEEPVKEPPKTSTPKAGSTWAFWSRDSGSKTKGKEATRQKQDSDEEEGQLAVMGESSENQPQLQKTKSIEINGTTPKESRVQSPEADDSPSKSTSWLGTSPAKGSVRGKKSRRLRPQSMDLDRVSIESGDEVPKPDTAKMVEPPAKAGSSKTATTVPAMKPAQPNLLLPSFTSTYRLGENPSIVKQLTQLLLRTQQTPANHVYLTKEPPKIKKALAIGVHGLFPATYLRPMIGQPTGTSIKFANHAANSIRRWADRHNSADCSIEKVALEGEGKIAERLENLWKLLLNWIDTIRGADLVILACHSQGVPVTIMLLAKLIELGVISSSTRVGVCAMAGVSLGPFPDYRSGMGILMGSAAELWEFSNPTTEISRRLEASIKTVLDAGARITFVGSMDDQLVPMESAIYSPAHHPYIYRSVFIDGRIHAPDFIAHLVGFALKLRNMGVKDHGLVRELSLPLAGSLYSGEGHSRLYDEEGVYDLAVSHALETTDLVVPPKCEMHRFESLTQPNPYHLPWIMRGLLEEDFVKTELNEETSLLLRQFDDWKPVTKALKDVKYRLEAVRSKL